MRHTEPGIQPVGCASLSSELPELELAEAMSLDSSCSCAWSEALAASVPKGEVGSISSSCMPASRVTLLSAATAFCLSGADCSIVDKRSKSTMRHFLDSSGRRWPNMMLASILQNNCNGLVNKSLEYTVIALHLATYDAPATRMLAHPYHKLHTKIKLYVSVNST